MPYGLQPPPGVDRGQPGDGVQGSPSGGPPPGAGLPQPPPSIADNSPQYRSPLTRALPGIIGGGIGLLGAATGNQGLANFGIGMGSAGTNSFLEQNQQIRQRELEREDNLIKNVDAQMQKVRQLQDPNDPRHAEIMQALQAYDQAMQDGKMTAKEAVKLHQMVNSVGNLEGMLSEAELKRKTAEQIKLAEIQSKLKNQNNIQTPYGMMAPEDYARIKAQEASMKSSEDRSDARLRMQAQFEEGRDRRQMERLDQQAKLFGQGQDIKFADKLGDFDMALQSVGEIGDSLKRFQNTGMFSPMQKALAAQELRSKVSSLSTSIGRSLGERGVFTDQDRATFTKIINPGLVISELAPQEAQKRLNDLTAFIQSMKQKKAQRYRLSNPNTALPEVQGLTPPPAPSEKLFKYKGQTYTWDQLPPEGQALAKSKGQGL